MSVKLHLGCGKRHIHDYINIDLDHTVNPDICRTVHDIYPEYIEVDEIYACHVLEHFSRKISPTYMEVLANWYSALRSGGILKVAVPDFGTVVGMYWEGKAFLEDLQGFLNGGQKSSLDIHYVNFDYPLLKKSLEAVGFKKVAIYDWRTTSHAHIDDYSQSFLPHMDKVNGTLMSLNMYGVKP